jgi:very-short-patch-repair endonuclease
MRKIIRYKPYLKALARILRNNSTKSEIELWSHLKGKQMLGYDFHRQKPIDRYIVDFYCCDLMLAIELDGLTHHHEETLLKDIAKEQRLIELGITVLRFDDEDVMKGLDWVLEKIKDKIRELETHL